MYLHQYHLLELSSILIHYNHYCLCRRKCALRCSDLIPTLVWEQSKNCCCFFVFFKKTEKVKQTPWGIHSVNSVKSCATQVRKENIIIYLCKWLRERLFGQSQKYTEIQSIQSHKLITWLLEDSFSHKLKTGLRAPTAVCFGRRN